MPRISHPVRLRSLLAVLAFLPLVSPILHSAEHAFSGHGDDDSTCLLCHVPAGKDSTLVPPPPSSPSVSPDLVLGLVPQTLTFHMGAAQSPTPARAPPGALLPPA